MLREPADHAARSAALTARVVDHLARTRDPEAVTVLDLGAGAGSNLRYLEPHLPAYQHWLLVDHDAELLHEASGLTMTHGLARGLSFMTDGTRATLHGRGRRCQVLTRVADLAALDDADLFAGRTLVTGAALLDLVSDAWLEQLAARCRATRATVLFTLTYDGRIACDPHDPDDEFVRRLVNRHQHGDKGFGPAAGPDATAVARACFERAGFDVQVEPSDWVLDPGAADLQRPLIDGWAGAAREIAPDDAARIDAWRDRRIADIDAGRSRLRVGHQDLAAWPRE